MADIKIIVDSGSDIPQDIADKYNIRWYSDYFTDTVR